MSRRLVAITLDNLDDLPAACRRCVSWELGPARRETCDPLLEKEAWISTVLLEWGSCGLLAYVDGKPAGHVLFAPPAYVPRSLSFPSSPVSPDAVLLMTSSVRPEHAGTGLGRMLVQGVAKELRRRGVRAIEAFGSFGPAPAECVLPAEHLRAVGFKTVRPHPRHPRLRLELRTLVTLREDVELALERLLGGAPSPQWTVRSAGAARPAPSGPRSGAW
jgi:GNAT superfamily N-acetyltransferase